MVKEITVNIYLYFCNGCLSILDIVIQTTTGLFPVNFNLWDWIDQKILEHILWELTLYFGCSWWRWRVRTPIVAIRMRSGAAIIMFWHQLILITSLVFYGHPKTWRRKKCFRHQSITRKCQAYTLSHLENECDVISAYFRRTLVIVSNICVYSHVQKWISGLTRLSACILKFVKWRHSRYLKIFEIAQY